MIRTRVALLGIALAVAGCSKAWLSPKLLVPSERLDQVHQVAEKYSVDLRWGRVDEAARSVAPDLRPAFRALMKDPDRAPHFTLIELESVKLTEERERAEVRVRFQLYNPPAIIERQIVEHQTWRFDHDRRAWYVEPDLALYQGEVAGR